MFVHSNSLFLVQINGLHCVIKRRMPPPTSKYKLKVCLHVAYFQVALNISNLHFIQTRSCINSVRRCQRSAFLCQVGPLLHHSVHTHFSGILSSSLCVALQSHLPHFAIRIEVLSYYGCRLYIIIVVLVDDC